MGPLNGLRIIEMAGLGPGPFAGMLMADMGAEVILVERQEDGSKTRTPFAHRRGKKSIVLNLKDQSNKEILLKMVEKADVLFEGYRPGVMEKLGVGPEVCLEINPKLVYVRMTGWGQEGPLSNTAGHDINYISLTGVLHAIGGSDGPPIPPLNLVGDYGGGGMFLVTGILAAIIDVKESGKGQVVDVAMTDGSATLMSVFNSLDAMGNWSTERGSNWLDSGAHFYNTYKTKDSKYISIGSIEPQFYSKLLQILELDPDDFAEQYNRDNWERYKYKMGDLFKSKTRDEWCDILEGTDTCFAPVLDYKEAQTHPHNVERQTYVEVDGINQPAPTPRFSRTISEIRSGSPYAGEHTEQVLREWGISK